MVISKSYVVSLFQALLIFFCFWASKKPLIYLINGVSVEAVQLTGIGLILLTSFISWVLFKVNKPGPSIFLLVLMLFLVPIGLFYANEFGAYKSFSLILMLNLISIIYLVGRKFYDIDRILITIASVFLLYGLFFGIYLNISGFNFSEREVIGFNGPIVFGQYMIISFSIFLIYWKRIKAVIAYLISFLSLSKSVMITGILSIFLNSQNKIKLFLISLPILFLAFQLFDFNTEVRVLYWIQFITDFETLLTLSSFSARAAAYTQSYELISNSYQGLGLGGWMDISYLRYPHNIFLEILVEFPLFFGLLLIFFMFTFFMIIKDRRYKILFCLMLFMALFSGSLIDNRGIFFITMLFLLSDFNHNKLSQNDEH